MSVSEFPRAPGVQGQRASETAARPAVLAASLGVLILLAGARASCCSASTRGSIISIRSASSTRPPACFVPGAALCARSTNCSTDIWPPPFALTRCWLCPCLSCSGSARGLPCRRHENQPLSLGLRPGWLWLILAAVLVVSVLRNLPGAPFAMLRP